jgi:hypothetical protein
VKGTRELFSPPYVVVYRSTEEIVEILHVWQGGARLALTSHKGSCRSCCISRPTVEKFECGTL